MEIEQVIYQIPEVSSVKVVGISVSIIQEKVVACIIWKDNKSKSAEYVQKYVGSQLADYKIPKYVLSFKEFPINSNGKILSNELAELSNKLIEQG